MQASTDDHDGPWKEALELFFPEALALLAPALYQAIDWSYPAEFLDKELQALRYPDKSARLAPLIALVRALYGYGYAQDTIRRLLRLIEWMVQLPAELERDYIQVMEQLEQEHDMGYVTIAERLGIQKGREEGQADLLLRLIERRFGPVPEAVTQRVHTAGAEQLERWALNFVDAATVDQVFRE